MALVSDVREILLLVVEEDHWQTKQLCCVAFVPVDDDHIGVHFSVPPDSNRSIFVWIAVDLGRPDKEIGTLEKGAVLLVSKDILPMSWPSGEQRKGSTKVIAVVNLVPETHEPCALLLVHRVDDVVLVERHDARK